MKKQKVLNSVKKAEKIVNDQFHEIKDQSKDYDDIIHKLRVHQFELEMQNEELIENQIKLEDSRGEYFDLYMSKKNLKNLTKQTSYFSNVES